MTDHAKDYDTHANSARAYLDMAADDIPDIEARRLIAAAQVHATLALAAATVRPEIKVEARIEGSGAFGDDVPDSLIGRLT